MSQQIQDWMYVQSPNTVIPLIKKRKSLPSGRLIGSATPVSLSSTKELVKEPLSTLDDLCKQINRITAITPAIYKYLSNVYRVNGTITKYDIYHILGSEDSKRQEQMFQKIKKMIKRESIKQLPDQIEDLYQQSRRVLPVRKPREYYSKLEQSAERLKPLLLKVIPVLSFQQYNQRARKR